MPPPHPAHWAAAAPQLPGHCDRALLLPGQHLRTVSLCLRPSRFIPISAWQRSCGKLTCVGLLDLSQVDETHVTAATLKDTDG